MVAVSQNGNSLKYAPERLRDGVHIVNAAVSQNGWALAQNRGASVDSKVEDSNVKSIILRSTTKFNLCRPDISGTNLKVSGEIT